MSAFAIALDVRNKRMQMKRAVRLMKKLGVPLSTDHVRGTYAELKEAEAAEVVRTLRIQLEQSGDPQTLVEDIQRNQRFFRFEPSYEDRQLGLL